MKHNKEILWNTEHTRFHVQQDIWKVLPPLVCCSRRSLSKHEGRIDHVEEIWKQAQTALHWYLTDSDFKAFSYHGAHDS